MSKINLIINNKKAGYIAGLMAEQFMASVLPLAQKKLPPGWDWVNSSNHAVVAKNTGDQNSQQVFFKMFLHRSLGEGIKAFLKGSRCHRSIQQSDVLLKHGFNAPEVYCWGRCLSYDFMITQAIVSIGYGDYIKNYSKLVEKQNKPKNIAEIVSSKRLLVSSLGSLIGRLHQTGIIHGDLRPNNILVQTDYPIPEFYFIDNERNKFYKYPPRKLIIKNLVQIMMFFPKDLSFTYRQRFYKNYFSTVGRFNLNEQKKITLAVHEKVKKRLKGRSCE